MARVNYNDTTPPAVGAMFNVKWQYDSAGNVSASYATPDWNASSGPAIILNKPPISYDAANAMTNLNSGIALSGGGHRYVWTPDSWLTLNDTAIGQAIVAFSSAGAGQRTPIKLPASGVLGFASGNNIPTDPIDVAIQRAGAGLLQVSDSNGNDMDLRARSITASGNLNALSLTATSTAGSYIQLVVGSPAAAPGAQTYIRSNGGIYFDNQPVTFSRQAEFVSLHFTSASSDQNDGRLGAAIFQPGLNIVGINNDGTYRKLALWGQINQQSVVGAGANQLQATAINTSLTLLGNAPISASGGDGYVHFTSWIKADGFAGNSVSACTFYNDIVLAAPSSLTSNDAYLRFGQTLAGTQVNAQYFAACDTPVNPQAWARFGYVAGTGAQIDFSGGTASGVTVQGQLGVIGRITCNADIVMNKSGTAAAYFQIINDGRFGVDPTFYPASGTTRTQGNIYASGNVSGLAWVPHGSGSSLDDVRSHMRAAKTEQRIVYEGDEPPEPAIPVGAVNFIADEDGFHLIGKKAEGEIWEAVVPWTGERIPQ